MELGEKLRLARLEAGLSQRQLCGEEITRNMLSQIEHGTARPSMKTLQYLASRLGKTVSYFLEEEAVLSPNQQVMTQVRQYFDSGEFDRAAETLEGYRTPDPVYDREMRLLTVLIRLAQAEAALEAGKQIYAREILNHLDVAGCYCAESLQRQRLLLLGRVGDSRVAVFLPSLDKELQLRAREAFEAGETERAGKLLDAAEDQTDPVWNLLRGQVFLSRTCYEEAAVCFHKAEEDYPRETAFRLEHCYRELGDYKRAYEYACKQRR